MNQIEVAFNYNGVITVIQCYENENIKDIFNRFATKSFINEPNQLICTYNGSVLNINSRLSIYEIANSVDKNQKKMSILVTPLTVEVTDFYVISKDIICPICKEICQIIFNNYKITFF